MKYIPKITALLLAIVLTGCSSLTSNNNIKEVSPSENSTKKISTEQDNPQNGISTSITNSTKTPKKAVTPAQAKIADILAKQDKISIDKSLKWKLVWSDEFNEPDIDSKIWTLEKGVVRFGELQYFTDRPENARIEKGNLVIEAQKEDYEGSKYTSASLVTRGAKSFRYGKIEMRAKLPYGKGIWPAFWTLGAEYGSWPACGEIDIMELIGGGKGRDDTIYGSVHWSDGGEEHKFVTIDTHLNKGIFADDYHIIGVEWDAKEIRFYLDGKEYTRQDITREDMADEFHQFHYILLNLSLGGSWAGEPDETTIFPQKYIIDWVRVYQRSK